MKKYSMLILTLLMLLLTTVVYIYDNSGQAPQIKQPYISIDTKKFGLIKNIIWPNEYTNIKNSLILLSTKKTTEGNMSYLYNLNIDTGKSIMLAEFRSHKNLNNVILFSSPMGDGSIIAAYDKGIVKVKTNPVDYSSDTVSMIEVPGFENATSMDFKNSLIYTRENDNILYSSDVESSQLGFAFNNPNYTNTSTYYLKPFYVANLNSLDRLITYTSLNRDQINLYALKDGKPVNTFNTPVIKNVVTVRGVKDSFGFTGMNILDDKTQNKNLSIFLIRHTIDNYNHDNFYNLDTIPYNTDPFGAVPAIDSYTFNEKFSLVYTVYDKSHRGTINICGLNQSPKVILKGENIFGPVSITQYPFDEDGKLYILYFSLENKKVKIKICNENGDLVKDLTDVITGDT
ncbi:hypothetical protein [Clostridium sp. C8-1-8]|uniref:hypothetical protein n=1 Tax=Clostridium sp. C8-1-8 TaxID=2698831 RepID=UPI00136CA72F|nr:hypothetical protein [Clostridium sp. C8-1-8]